MKPLISRLAFLLATGAPAVATVAAGEPIFDMAAMRDASTLDTEVVQDWHRVEEPVPTRLDFFSNHRKTIRYKGKAYPTYLSSPYTRMALKE